MKLTFIPALLAAAVIAGCSSTGTSDEIAIALKTMGSFAFGGSVDYLEDGTTFHGDHGYAQYYIAAHSRHLPVVMWHGIGQSGKTFESTVDGREGFQALLPRDDWSVYIIDQPRRGRAGYTRAGREGGRDNIPTTSNEADVWEAFRNGPWSKGGEAQLFAGSQFPLSPESVEQFFRQQTVDTGAEPWTAEYRCFMGQTAADLFAAIGEGILITHSNSGQYGWEAVMHAEGRIRALIAFEPGASVFPEDSIPEDLEIANDLVRDLIGLRTVPREHWNELLHTPILIIYGDNIADEPNSESFNAEIWRVSRARAYQMAELINAEGGDAQVLELPKIGIHGNTHTPFADLNNKEILRIVEDFISEKGLDGYENPHTGPRLPAPADYTMPLSLTPAQGW